MSDGGIHLPAAQVGDKKQWWRIEQLGTRVSKPELQVGDTVVTPLHFSHFEFDDGSGWKIVDTDQIHGMIEKPTPDI